MIDAIVSALRPIQFRGKHRLLRRFVPCDGTRFARVHGAMMELDLADWIQRQMYLGCYERVESRAVAQRLRPGDIFVDVGANVGYFTALAAARVGKKGRVVAIEPSPYAFERLHRMVEQNHLDHVTSLPVGLSSHAGRIQLFVPPPGSGNHTPTMVPNAGGIGVEVSVTTLDACLSQQCIERARMLKLDVEGHEPQVLAGASESLWRGCFDFILVEFNELWLGRSGSSPLALLEQLRASGYEPDPRSGAPQLREGGVETVLFKRSQPSS